MLRVITNQWARREQWIVVRDDGDGRPTLIGGPYDHLRTAMLALNRMKAMRELVVPPPQRRKRAS